MLEPLENKFSLFNEIMVSFYIYQLLSLTDYPSEPMPSRDVVGWSLVITVLVSALVNLLKFFYLIFSTTKIICIKRKLRIEHERKQKYLEEKAKNDAAT
jgi:hypothetical protein